MGQTKSFLCVNGLQPTNNKEQESDDTMRPTASRGRASTAITPC